MGRHEAGVLDVLTAVIYMLATYRATRLIVTDSVWAEARRRLLAKILGQEHRWWRAKLHELLQCPYCISVWVAFAVVLAGPQVGEQITPRFLDVILSTLAVAGGAMVVWRFVEE